MRSGWTVLGFEQFFMHNEEQSNMEKWKNPKKTKKIPVKLMNWAYRLCKVQMNTFHVFIPLVHIKIHACKSHFGGIFSMSWFSTYNHNISTLMNFEPKCSRFSIRLRHTKQYRHQRHITFLVQVSLFLATGCMIMCKMCTPRNQSLFLLWIY